MNHFTRRHHFETESEAYKRIASGSSRNIFIPLTYDMGFNSH